MTRKTMFVGWTLTVLFGLALLEVFSFAAVSLAPQLQGSIYSEPEISEQEFAEVTREMNPDLGWPGEQWLQANADVHLARNAPNNEALVDENACLSLYGDSFTFSDEVADEDAWGNVLAGSLGCRVANYGVGGYGTDQALLRFEKNQRDGIDTAKSIILSVYPVNLNRIVNRWRYLVGGHPMSFKPMFALRDGDFELLPVFDGDYERFRRIGADPGTYLEGEDYLPDPLRFGRKVTAGFPYSLTLGKIVFQKALSIRTFDTSKGMSFINFPAYHDTRDGTDTRKVKTLKYLTDRFAEQCRSNGFECAIMLIPDPDLLFQIEKYGNHDLQWILQDADPDLLTLDATGVFKSVEDICASVTQPASCSGHFNPSGYKRLADFVEDSIRNAGWLVRRGY